MSAARVLILIVSILLAVPLALFGIFAILYTGDSRTPSDTYVEVSGEQIDADVAGTGAVILALILALVGVLVIRRRR